ncbi:hypothetical protein IAU60_000028 [Kwoniella sp. DSM 27419]
MNLHPAFSGRPLPAFPFSQAPGTSQPGGTWEWPGAGPWYGATDGSGLPSQYQQDWYGAQPPPGWEIPSYPASTRTGSTGATGTSAPSATTQGRKVPIAMGKSFLRDGWEQSDTIKSALTEWLKRRQAQCKSALAEGSDTLEDRRKSLDAGGQRCTSAVDELRHVTTLLARRTTAVDVRAINTFVTNVLSPNLTQLRRDWNAYSEKASSIRSLHDQFLEIQTQLDGIADRQNISLAEVESLDRKFGKLPTEDERSAESLAGPWQDYLGAVRQASAGSGGSYIEFYEEAVVEPLPPTHESQTSEPSRARIDPDISRPSVKPTPSRATADRVPASPWGFDLRSRSPPAQPAPGPSPRPRSSFYDQPTAAASNSPSPSTPEIEPSFARLARNFGFGGTPVQSRQYSHWGSGQPSTEDPGLSHGNPWGTMQPGLRPWFPHSPFLPRSHPSQGWTSPGPFSNTTAPFNPDSYTPWPAHSHSSSAWGQPGFAQWGVGAPSAPYASSQ